MNTAHSFQVRGMHCASCAAIVEKTLRKQAGVAAAEVSYTAGLAKVDLDETQVRLEDLSTALAPLGFSLQAALGPQDQSARAHSDRQEALAEVAALLAKVRLALPMAAVALGVMGWRMLAEVELVPMPSPAGSLAAQALLGVLASLALFYVGTPYLAAMGRFARHGAATMDTLIGLGTSAAYIYSVILLLLAGPLRAYLPPSGEGYFDVTIVVIAFVSLGKYFEARARLKTGDALESLLGLQAKNALVLREGRELEIPVDQVRPGELIIIKPGAKIPVDGMVVEGTSALDESLVTGESMPVEKGPGAAVVAGTLNTTGNFTFRATKIGADTLLAHIIRLVGEAQASKAPVQSLADRIAAVFVPAVLVIAAVALGAWLLLGVGSLGLAQALAMGISSFVCVLVIACPCALGLATPAAVTVGIGQGARAGILIKDAATLQKLRNVAVVVVDKTGTLTRGRPELVEFRALPGVEEPAALALLAALEKKSEHPIAHAIVSQAEQRKITLPAVTSFAALQGQGVRGQIAGVEYFAGSEALARQQGWAMDDLNFDAATRQGRTPVLLGAAGKLLAIAWVADAPKPSAAAAVARLHTLGIRVIMLTGDHENTARYIAGQVGVTEVVARALPADKLNKIKELQAAGLVVAMAGDGVNDAPALAQADVGIAMGDGADAAIETAGVALLRGDIGKLAEALTLSRHTMRVIKQNLFWAFAFNLAGIPLAAGLFYPWFGWTLSPMFAGLAMSLSSVAVVTNALRLKTLRLQ